MRILAHWVSFVKVSCSPSFVGLLLDVKLHRVVTSSDGLDIPVDVLVVLHSLDVVVIDDGEQVDEHSDAADQKAKDTSLLGVGAFDDTTNLGIDVCLSTALAVIGWLSSNPRKFREPDRNRTVCLVVAVSVHVVNKLCSVEVVCASRSFVL